MTDFSGKSYLLNKILGGSRPETQVNVNLTINLVTSIISALLLGFLNGFYDAQHARTGEAAPPVIYLVYIFLGLVSAWQFLSFLIGLKLKSKLSGKKKDVMPLETSAGETTLSSGSTQKSLPQADFENIVPSSVTEDTTKMLNKVPRKQS